MCGPPHNAGANLHTAHDGDLNSVVIFGGTDGVTASSETWLWNGAWSRAADGPTAQAGAELSYSPVLRASVLTGNGQLWHWADGVWTRGTGAGDFATIQ